MKVTIIEYGIGNIQSVFNSCQRLGYKIEIAKSGNALDKQNPNRIILPGVGAIGKALDNLKKRGFLASLNKHVIKNNVPFLGICVGMQILATSCNEFGCFKGLNWIPGKVDQLFEKNTNFKLPHVGWNSLNVVKNDEIFNFLNGKDLYFVHSQAFSCDDKYIVSKTNYNVNFVSIVRNKHILGVQFHPEKSSSLGQKLIDKFISNNYA